jgi:hypothetical protein
VIGGCSDEEFAEDSRAFFDLARGGSLVVLVSDIVIGELEAAPPAVLQVLAGLPPASVEKVPITPDILALRDACVTAGVVPHQRLNDAAHVAAATVARADAIVSWNFRHIVRLDRIKAYNAVNLLNGFGVLTILSPREVVGHGPHEEQDL